MIYFFLLDSVAKSTLYRFNLFIKIECNCDTTCFDTLIFEQILFNYYLKLKFIKTLFV